MVSVLPQLVTVAVVGVTQARRDLPTCLFLQTVVFVAFNSVATAQYFVWYFCFLPLALLPGTWDASASPTGGEASDPKDADGPSTGALPLIDRRILFSGAAWLVAQVGWLGVAYFLEFRSLGVFPALWGASVVFLGANACFITRFVATLTAGGKGMDGRVDRR